jgi:hypothetical protein
MQMSRGLGKMQRLILSSLDESKRWMGEADVQRRGCFIFPKPRYWNHCPTETEPLIVRVRGERFFLDDDTYDLAATLQYLAEIQDKMQPYIHGFQVSQKFLNSFWRAAKRLIETSYLVRWRSDTTRIVYKGLRLTQLGDKCVTTDYQHLAKKYQSET